MDEGLDRVELLQSRGFNVEFVSHARSILIGDFPEALMELNDVLLGATLPITEIIGSGGGETRFTQRIRRGLAEWGWTKHNFQVDKIIDGRQAQSTSHEVDHVKSTPNGTIGCEIEWNNKDPFFDRDLENFKRLHAEGAISVGIIITRGDSLQSGMRDMVSRFATDRGIADFAALRQAGVQPTSKQRIAIEKRLSGRTVSYDFVHVWTDNFVSNKFGAATTHWDKLQARVQRGVGNPCPLLLIGLPSSIVTFDDGKVELVAVDEDVESTTLPPP